MRLFLAASACLGVTLLSACSGEVHQGTTGELGVGKFRHVCTASGDFVCADTFGEDDFNDEQRRLPDAVAVGSEFGIELLGKVGGSADRSSLLVEAVRRADEPYPQRFVIRQPAEAVFVASKSSGDVYDYVVVRAREAVAMQAVLEGEPLTELSLKVGESVILSAVPLDAAGASLGGALSYFWSVGDDSVVEREREHAVSPKNHGDGGDVRLTGVSPGRSWVRAKSGVLGVQVPVVVE